MQVIIKSDYDEMSRAAAEHVIRRINESNPTPENPFVLGLPTGSSPIGMYQELVKAVKEQRVSFRNVITFNMDEYVGLPEEHPESYHSFMHRNFSTISTFLRKTSIFSTATLRTWTRNAENMRKRSENAEALTFLWEA